MKEISDLKAVIHEHYATLCAVAIKLVKSPDVAEDLVQEAIITYWEQRAKNVHISSIGNYLFTLVKHAGLNYLRAERRASERHERYVKTEEEDPLVLNLLIEEESNRSFKRLSTSYRRCRRASSGWNSRA
ncbi:MAG: hypothetical protein LBP56_05495 [Odoribacteraceae bacterium]|jgi:RNA polymerase sigma-70 factor (ECF subfamily)|nr:hypothetical protein [Odoribacteraceae bacterium]